MSSHAASYRVQSPASGPVARKLATLSGAVGAVTACLAALTTFSLIAAAPAAAAAYPPTQPCAVAATQRGTTGTAMGAGAPRVVAVDVVGTGLEAGQGVRISLSSNGRALGWTRADANGNFQTVVDAPAQPGAGTPAVSAATRRSGCSSDGPGNGGGNGAGNGAGNGGGPTTPGRRPDGPRNVNPGVVSPGGTGVPTVPTTSPTETPTATATPTASSGPASGPITGRTAGPTSGTSTSPLPPRADAPRISGPSLGVGLAIAAALLVLGTLAVLILTRRPEH